MTNAELIATLRGENYFVTLLHDAADALEAADKRIAELERILKAVQENSGINFRLWQEAEAQMQKEGVRIINPHGELREMLIDEMIDEMIDKGEWLDEQRGRWIYAKCNLCDKVQDVRSNYCPNCGARMDGDTENANTYSLGKIEMPNGAMKQIIADGERKEKR